MSMEATAVQSAALAGSVNADMSIWGLFLQADFCETVMIGLLLASFGAGQLSLKRSDEYGGCDCRHPNLETFLVRWIFR